MKHFQHLRLEVLRLRCEEAGSHERGRLSQTFRYYLTSVQSLKSLLGRAVDDILTKIQKQPILSDPAIRDVDALEIDRTLHLLPDEIRNFTPYTKRYAPTTAETREILESWSTELSSVFVDGVKTFLKDQRAVPEVFSLRKELLSILLPMVFSLPGHETLLNGMRDVFNSRIQEICGSHIASLGDVAQTITAGHPDSNATKSLWQPTYVQAPLFKGAHAFISQLPIRHEGTAGKLQKISKALQSWLLALNTQRSRIEELKAIRWGDMLEEPDEEDEDSTAMISKQLGKEDPQAYETGQQRALATAISAFQDNIVERAPQLSPTTGSVEAVYLLRAIRTSIHVLRQASAQAVFDKLDEIVPHLYSILAQDVLARLSKEMQKNHNINQSALMNNLPENIPSPRAFNTLRRLCLIMAEVGGHDIWSVAAVEAVKRMVREKLIDAEQKELYMVNAFDEAYLRAALGDRSRGGSDNERSEETKKAEEYWSRTKLLFGVLM